MKGVNKCKMFFNFCLVNESPRLVYQLPKIRVFVVYLLMGGNKPSQSKREYFSCLTQNGKKNPHNVNQFYFN